MPSDTPTPLADAPTPAGEREVLDGDTYEMALRRLAGRYAMPEHKMRSIAGDIAALRAAPSERTEGEREEDEMEAALDRVMQWDAQHYHRVLNDDDAMCQRDVYRELLTAAALRSPDAANGEG